MKKIHCFVAGKLFAAGPCRLQPHRVQFFGAWPFFQFHFQRHGCPGTESDAVEETSSAPQESVPSFDTTATIQETVLYEENGVKITATGLECSLSQVALDLTIENNSSQDLSFSSATTGV